jgi:UTP--glucose-1-phosphate uridylyltransferase
MLPAAKAVPKEMLPVLGKPTIQYVVEEAAAAGSSDVLLVTSREKKAIEDHFDRTPELEARLAATGKMELLSSLVALREKVQVFSVRQMEQLGLGHAVLQGKRHVGAGDEPFLCLLGDTIFSPKAQGGRLPAEQLVEVYRRLPAGSSVIGLERVAREKVSKYGIVAGRETGDGLVRIESLVEKPSPESAPSDLAIAARYLLSAGVFEFLEKLTPGKGGELQLTDAINAMCRGGSNVYGVVLESHRHDIGSPEGWLATNLRFAREDERMWKSIEPVVRELMR